MYYELANRLSVPYDRTLFSQAAALGEGNAIFVGGICVNFKFTGSSAKCRVTVQQSNDLANWTDLSGSDPAKLIDFTSERYLTLKITDISAKYVRLKYEAGGSALSGYVLLTLDMNTVRF